MYHRLTRSIIWFCLGFVLMIAVGMTSACDTGSSVIQIDSWVKAEYKVEKHYTIPAIQFVSREKMYGEWARVNEKHLAEMDQEYLNLVRTGLNGLFIPAENTIYVCDALAAVKRDSIVAHELLHFYQQRVNGKAVDADEHFFREMEASALEKKYCSSHA